jgi:hypothetical protein
VHGALQQLHDFVRRQVDVLLRQTEYGPGPNVGPIASPLPIPSSRTDATDSNSSPSPAGTKGIRSATNLSAVSTAGTGEILPR